MRKVMKRKRRSCSFCKPNKTGGEVRWSARAFDALKRSDKEIREACRSR